MILVGDQIDCTLGVKFGLSTMAAAGFGNLISDVVGISLGEVIEAGVAKVLSAPPLTYEQLQLRTTRLVKGSANAIGITIGCLLGMVPLLWMNDRKAVFFNDDELDVYHSSFAPYGVSPQQFFALLRHGDWRTAEAGTVLVRQGGHLETTMFLHNGSALGTVSDATNGSQEVTAVYEGRSEPMETKDELSHMTRGCIIGGTALVDQGVGGKPYPNTVTVTRPSKFLEWRTEELREAMREDKSIEAAVLNTLYVDLVRGIREQRSLERKKSVAGGTHEDRVREYEVMMRAVLADGLAHPLEKSMLKDFKAKHGVNDADHIRTIEACGWTQAEWERGVRATVEQSRTSSLYGAGQAAGGEGGVDVSRESGGGEAEPASSMQRTASSQAHRRQKAARIRLSHTVVEDEAARG